MLFSVSSSPRVLADFDDLRAGEVADELLPMLVAEPGEGPRAVASSEVVHGDLLRVVIESGALVGQRLGGLLAGRKAEDARRRVLSAIGIVARCALHECRPLRPSTPIMSCGQDEYKE